MVPYRKLSVEQAGEPSAAIRERAEPGAVVQLCQVASGSLSSVDALCPERPSGVRGFGCLGEDMSGGRKAVRRYGGKAVGARLSAAILLFTALPPYRLTVFRHRPGRTRTCNPRFCSSHQSSACGCVWFDLPVIPEKNNGTFCV